MPTQQLLPVRDLLGVLTAPEKNIDGDKIDISLDGKFVSSNKATGTVDYDSKGCKGKSVDFVAKYSGVIS